nr:MAG TPA: hypothetical protein [Caudoviricetes sp.]
MLCSLIVQRYYFCLCYANLLAPFCISVCFYVEKGFFPLPVLSILMLYIKHSLIYSYIILFPHSSCDLSSKFPRGVI